MLLIYNQTDEEIICLNRKLLEGIRLFQNKFDYLGHVR